MTDNESKSSRKPSFFKTLMEDSKNFAQSLFSGRIKQLISRDFKELQDFYLTQEQRNRLAGMSKWRRWLPSGFWLIKAMILKLSPVRRVLLFLGIFSIRILSDSVFFLSFLFSSDIVMPGDKRIKQIEIKKQIL